MTIHVATCKRLRVYEEPNGSFAVDHSGTLGDYLEVPFIEGTDTLALEEPTESPMHSQQHIDGHPEEVLMPRSWRFGHQIGIESLTTRAGNATQAAQGALGRLLKIAMGTETRQTGTTINDASATTTSFTVASGAGLTKGCAIALATGTGGALEAREIKNVATNVVTLKHALSSAPANGSTVYASATYTLGTGNGDDVTSAQFAFEGLEPDDRWLLKGGQLAATLAFSLGVGGIPRVTFEWMGPRWEYANGTNTSGTLTGSALSTSTYSNNLPLVVNASDLRMYTVGTTSLSGTQRSASSFEFNPNLVYTPVKSPSGTETVLLYVRTRSAPVIAGSFVQPYEGQTWFTAKANKTDHAFALQIGASATTGCALITAPCVQVTDVQLQNVEGVQGERVSWKGRLDTDVTTITTDVHRSAFRVHIF